MKVIEDLFDKLLMLYGRAWTSLFPSGDEEFEVMYSSMMKVWYGELKDLTRNQIFLALDKYKNSDAGKIFPPNPLQLHKLTLPSLEDFGMPEPESAYDCAIKRNYVHPAVYHAASDVGFYEMRTLSDKEARKRFFARYQERCKQVMSGEDLKIPNVYLLPESVKAPAKKETAKSAISKMKEALGCRA